MKLTTHKKFKAGRLMPWGKATVVSGATGYVFLSGNTATVEDYDPLRRSGGGIADPAMLGRAILATIKADLEEAGSALEHLVKMTFYVKGPFPSGGVLSSPNFRLDVLDEFFAEHRPKHCSYNNPPPSEVIGVAALAAPDLATEIVAIAALPDDAWPLADPASSQRRGPSLVQILVRAFLAEALGRQLLGRLGDRVVAREIVAFGRALRVDQPAAGLLVEILFAAVVALRRVHRLSPASLGDSFRRRRWFRA